MGFGRAHFCNFGKEHELQRNALQNRQLHIVGNNGLLPADNGLGGANQGQIRDRLPTQPQPADHDHPDHQRYPNTSHIPLPPGCLILLAGLASCLIVPLQRGSIYARYSTKDQHSIEDQIRVCKERAEANNVEIRDEHMFVDRGITGRSADRDGLERLLQAIQADQVDVVVAFHTNRLFRKAYRSLQFVEEQIVERRKRAVFIRSGIDTAKTDHWRQMLHVHSMIDEMQTTNIAEHVRSAMEGVFLQGRVSGTITYGYTGQEIPGQKTNKGLPARIIVVDPVTSEWVRKAFKWFLDERLSLVDIARRLNEAKAPPPPLSRDGLWAETSVRWLLRNRRYSGRWSYGRMKSVWVSSKNYNMQVPRAEPLKEVQREDLRIIDEVTWLKAQELTATRRRIHAGRKLNKPCKERPRLLNGLLVCAEHQVPLRVGGNQSSRLFCHLCGKDPVPSLHSTPRRTLVQQQLCEALAGILRQDEALIEKIVTFCQQEAETLQKPDPSELCAGSAKPPLATRRITGNAFTDVAGRALRAMSHPAACASATWATGNATFFSSNPRRGLQREISAVGN